VRQVARNLTSSGCSIPEKCRCVIRNHDTKFTSGFDMIFQRIGIEALKLPPRSQNLNAFAERFVRSIKDECLDRMIFFGEASFHHAVTEYVAHHQTERSHQGIGNVIPFPAISVDNPPHAGPIICSECLGGMLKFYQCAAA